MTNTAREALERLLDRYVQLASSGDCGNWNPEEEEEVIAARAALASEAPGRELVALVDAALEEFARWDTASGGPQGFCACRWVEGDDWEYFDSCPTLKDAENDARRRALIAVLKLAAPVPSETQGLREAELSSDDLRLIDQAWENHKAALPVATVINNNQPGRTAIIEITIDPPTLDVGAKLYAEPKAITIATLSPAPGLVEAAEETDFDIINAEAEDANDRLSMLAQLVLNLDLGTPKGLRAKHYAQFCLGQRKDNPEGFPEPRVRARATGGSDAAR